MTYVNHKSDLVHCVHWTSRHRRYDRPLLDIETNMPIKSLHIGVTDEELRRNFFCGPTHHRAIEYLHGKRFIPKCPSPISLIRIYCFSFRCDVNGNFIYKRATQCQYFNCTLRTLDRAAPNPTTCFTTTRHTDLLDQQRTRPFPRRRIHFQRITHLNTIPPH